MLFKILGKVELEDKELLDSFTPDFRVGRKAEYFEKAREVFEKELTGTMKVTRCIPDDDAIEGAVLSKCKTSFNNCAGFFNYEHDQSNSERTVWWMNFADPELFGYYDGPLFAQDEIQVFEHPLLGSLRKYLQHSGNENLEPCTLMFNKNIPMIPTPYLIEDAPLWLRVNTRPVLSSGQQCNIYGNNFMYASDEEVEAGVHVAERNMKNNIMAVSAIVGHGLYSYEQIELLLKTLLCAFSSAIKVSDENHTKCVVHGGNWGCGAFGGNRQLMYFVQIYASGVTGVHELFIHDADEREYEAAMKMYEGLADETSFDSVVKMLCGKKYRWGFSDGN